MAEFPRRQPVASDIPPCGTDAAYMRHWRKGEPADDACKAAHNEAARPHNQVRTRALAQLAWEYPQRYRELLAEYRKEAAR